MSYYPYSNNPSASVPPGKRPYANSGYPVSTSAGIPYPPGADVFSRGAVPGYPPMGGGYPGNIPLSGSMPGLSMPGVYSGGLPGGFAGGMPGVYASGMPPGAGAFMGGVVRPVFPSGFIPTQNNSAATSLKPPLNTANDPNIESYKGVNINKKEMTDQQVQNVKNYLDFMAKDEDGSKLLRESGRTGPMTITYDPSVESGANVTGKTINLGKGILNNEQKYNFDSIEGMLGFSHEFVHAVTNSTYWGASKNEETMASTLGARIAGRYYGNPQSTEEQQATYDQWMNEKMKQDVYKDLPYDNNVQGTLANIGVRFNGLNTHPPEELES